MSGAELYCPPYDLPVRILRLRVFAHPGDSYTAAYVVFVPNKKSPLMGQKNIRTALLAAINVEPLMQVACGNARFYRLDCSSILMKETAWRSQSGCELYNQKTQKAAQPLQEAGYDGTSVRQQASLLRRKH
jgi:ABC-type oligopeptide transport system substrate-binding subunit